VTAAEGEVSVKVFTLDGVDVVFAVTVRLGCSHRV